MSGAVLALGAIGLPFAAGPSLWADPAGGRCRALAGLLMATVHPGEPADHGLYVGGGAQTPCRAGTGMPLEEISPHIAPARPVAANVDFSVGNLAGLGHHRDRAGHRGRRGRGASTISQRRSQERSSSGMAGPVPKAVSEGDVDAAGRKI